MDKLGYYRDLCSYFTMNLGFVSEGKDWKDVKYPSGGMAMPDLLLGDGVLCFHRVGWWHTINRILMVPMFIFESLLVSKWMTPGREDPHVIEYMVAQLMEAVAADKASRL